MSEENEVRIEMACRARRLQKKLEALKDEDLTEWLDVLGDVDVGEHYTDDELGWLDRVHTNILRFIPPALDNLDQVRWTLDKEKGGERGGGLEENSS